MIFFLTTRRNATPIRVYLGTDGRALAKVLLPMTYEKLSRAKTLPVGTWCFADLELLSPAERERAAAVWEKLADRGDRLLNRPTRSLLRYDLLRDLHRSGINRFDAYRPGETPRHFPVFLRGQDHAGIRPALLRSQAELDAALRGAKPDTLVIEFCGTADAEGVYRKYGAFIVGERILPRHLFFSRDWVVKDWDLLDEGKLLEEQRYLEKNPHERRLREIFSAAGIGYGRVDYSLLGDEIQVWEINTNPVILGIGPSVSRLGGRKSPLRRLAAPLLARFPALAGLRIAVARRWRKAVATPRPRARVHAAFATMIEAAWREVDPPPRAPPPRLTSDASDP